MNPRRNLSHLAGAAALLVAVLAAPGTTTAQDTGRESLLASYHDSSGNLPPPFAWSLSAIITTDDTLRAEYCSAYGPPLGWCREASTGLAPDAIKAVLAAARNSDLVRRPARVEGPPPTGGSSEQGMVMLDGVRIDLPPFPVNEDRARVTHVLDAVAAAIPGEMRLQLSAPNE